MSPRVSAFQPTTKNTCTPLIRGCDDVCWETNQLLKEEHRKILVEFILSPQTQLEDTSSKHQQLLPANSHVGRLSQRTLPRTTSILDEVVALTSYASLCESKFGICEENFF
ncbi:hypothetical protein KSP39_PZI006088 [Platanthera zijinensis]|uniref:Uncharacterized protein n=1 Tax=Platanthera zijinensis TaxID=2320716 RepID=A0AAP0BSN9_9ASPA